MLAKTGVSHVFGIKKENAANVQALTCFAACRVFGHSCRQSYRFLWPHQSCVRHFIDGDIQLFTDAGRSRGRTCPHARRTRSGRRDDQHDRASVDDDDCQRRISCHGCGFRSVLDHPATRLRPLVKPPLKPPLTRYAIAVMPNTG